MAEIISDLHDRADAVELAEEAGLAVAVGESLEALKARLTAQYVVGEATPGWKEEEVDNPTITADTFYDLFAGSVRAPPALTGSRRPSPPRSAPWHQQP
jgi:hypothetical protein